MKIMREERLWTFKGIRRWIIIGLWIEGFSISLWAGEITKIIPNIGEVGTYITVEGEGFLPTEAVRIDVGRSTGIGEAIADKAGKIKTVLQLNPQPAGQLRIKAIGIISRSYDSEPFVVKGHIRDVVPPKGGVGDFITVSGEGYGWEEDVSVNFGKNIGIGKTKTDGDGNFSVSFTIDTQPAGPKEIKVKGEVSGEEDVETLLIKSKLFRVYPAVGSCGTYVTLEGTGYGINEELRVDFGKTLGIGKASSNEDGVFFYAFKTDIQCWGPKNIIVNGLQSGEVSTAQFGIKSRIMSISPITGVVGDIITIKGTGFAPTESVRIDFVGQLSVSIPTTDENGVFETIFPIPIRPGGEGRRISTVGLKSIQIDYVDMFTLKPQIISVYPSVGPVNTMVTVSGNGFGRNEPICLIFDQLGTVTTGVSTDRGEILVAFSASIGNYGNKEIIVRSLTTDVSCYDKFMIVSRIVSVSPQVGPVGSCVTVIGDGYGMTETVRVKLDKNDIAVAKAVSGVFNAVFTVSPQIGGHKVIGVIGDLTNEKKESSFSVKGKISNISPLCGVEGQLVEIEGNGFGKSEQIEITFGKTKGAVMTTSDEEGNFKTQFTVIGEPGNENILVIGYESGQIERREFVILQEEER